MVLKKLLEDNLVDYVAMDIKNTLDDYKDITGLNYFQKSNIEESIKLLKSSKIDHEFRTTIMKEYHDIDKINKIYSLVEGDKYYLQNYKESEYVPNKDLHPFTVEELMMIKKNINKNIIIRDLYSVKDVEEVK